MKKSGLTLSAEQKEYIEAHTQELEELVLRLARIPAPSGKEEKRAKFCLEWLHENGAREAYIDDVGNVVYAYCGMKHGDAVGETSIAQNGDTVNGVDETDSEIDDAIVAYMAHMDVVFPDETELPLTEREGRIYCPGAGDNTANLAVLLMCAKYVAQYRPETDGRTLLFVCDVGEEGLGNLKGVREICRVFGVRIEAFYAFDLGYDSYTSRAVGSLRYRIQVRTKGGHSYGDFGNTNAIAVLAELIRKLYAVEVPKRGKTTYNVGTISGGTSVNTIAQQAEMLYEIRSDDSEDLAQMRAKFETVYLSVQHVNLAAEISVQMIGERPCESGVDEEKRKQLFDQVEAVVEAATGQKPKPVPCSTDCNIPLSIGIPSVCVGTCLGAGAHTREEYIEKDSLKNGLAIGLGLVRA